MNLKGCPKGARVHWFLLRLSEHTRRNYHNYYSREYNGYFLVRGGFGKQNLYDRDFFTVCRTSKRCWRVMGFNMTTGESVYLSLKDSQQAADYIDNISTLWQQQRAEISAL